MTTIYYPLVLIEDTAAAQMQASDAAGTLPAAVAADLSEFYLVSSRLTDVTISGVLWRVFAQAAYLGSIERMQAQLGSALQVAGVWSADGLQYGQSRDIDGAVIGTPTYAADTTLILAVAPDMPDGTRPATVQDALSVLPVISGQQRRTV